MPRTMPQILLPRGGAKPVLAVMAVLAALAVSILVPAGGFARAEGTQTAAAALPEIRLAVAEMQVIPAYASPRRPPNVEHKFRKSPQALAAAWGRARVRAVGTLNRARVIILEASVVEVPVKGKSSLFRRGPDRRYDAKLTLALQIRDDIGTLKAKAQATATRSQEVLKGVRGDRLKAIWHDLAEKLVADAVRELDRQVRRRLAQHVR